MQLFCAANKILFLLLVIKVKRQRQFTIQYSTYFDKFNCSLVITVTLTVSSGCLINIGDEMLT